jgi:hypothetical protein
VIRRLSGQEGVALPAAMGMMLVISLFIGAFFALAVRTSDTANQDRNAKRALAAAEAGLQTAIYRLNSIRPVIHPDACLTTGPVGVAELQPGECPAAPGDLGNGASYEYYVTPELDGLTPTLDANECVLLPGRTHDPRDRCVTSVGRVNGVSRRVQTRISKQVFGFPSLGVGLLGKSLFYAWNSVTLTSDVGSNGHVELINSITVNSGANVDGALKLPSTATTNYVNSVTVAANPDRQPVPPYDLPAVNFEPFDGDVLGENDNDKLIGDRTSDGDEVYDAATRSLDIKKGKYTLDPGTYHFCRVFIDDSVEIQRPEGGGPTKIYVDGRDDDRVGSPCTGANDGRFLVNNSVKFNTSEAQGELTEIYLHGTSRDNLTGVSPPDWDRPSWCTLRSDSYLTPGSPAHWAQCRSDFVLENSVEFYGKVYAPNSTIEARNGVKIWGAMAADSVRFFNSVEFKVFSGDDGGDETGTGPAIRRGWTECRPDPIVAGDPESGC